LERELSILKGRLLSLCALVEEQAHKAVRALLERDAALAQAVETQDAEIDRQEVEVEEECLKILALYQPVAIDLRLVVAVLKINNDLERIGDLGVNIAHKAAAFAAEPAMDIPFDLMGMWEKTQNMLRRSLDALMNMDAALAHAVCRLDDEVDQMKHDIRLQVEQMLQAAPSRVRPLLRLLAATRNLERIADCATNIAEDVIYMVEGRIVRHVKEE
jgi:phosphate transport system protein